MITHRVGELVKVILYVQDMNLQVAFYRDVLGLHVKEPEGVRDFRDFYRVELYTGGPCSLILHAGGKQQFGEDTPKIVFQIADIHAMRNELLQRGVLMGEVSSPTMGVFVCDGKDPEGNAFSIEQRLPILPTVGVLIETTGSVPTYVSVNSRRGRSITLLRDNRIVIVTEILLLILLLCLLPLLKVIPLISVLLVIMALMWLRGNTWNKLGLGHPRRWRRTVLLGLGFGLLFMLLQSFIVVPLVVRFTGKALDMHIFSTVHGNLPLLLGYLITTWTSTAFGEEMIFRAYLLNRLIDLFGRSFSGRMLSLIIQAIVFGIEHAYQGPVGIIIAAIYGLLLGLLYLGTKRNLWTCVIAHGLNDTIAFALAFLGI